MGLGALGVTSMAAAALASLVTLLLADIWRVLRGGWPQRCAQNEVD
ncbi:hypothetical protein X753_21295 [Mesorhizobium sp. LNJC399B00]|nr:hypothetical protein X753_21295 [Mesorhizobium sp. LNJC399B00]